MKERQSVQQASQRTAIIAQSTSHFDCQTAMQDLWGVEKEKSMASLIPPFSAYCKKDLKQQRICNFKLEDVLNMRM